MREWNANVFAFLFSRYLIFIWPVGTCAPDGIGNSPTCTLTWKKSLLVLISRNYPGSGRSREYLAQSLNEILTGRIIQSRLLFFQVEWTAVRRAAKRFRTIHGKSLCGAGHRRKWYCAGVPHGYKWRPGNEKRVPSVAKVLLPLMFSNLRNLGTERATAKEHQINSVNICSTYRLNRMLFCCINSRFPVKEVWNTCEVAILLPLIKQIHAHFPLNNILLLCSVKVLLSRKKLSLRKDQVLFLDPGLRSLLVGLHCWSPCQCLSVCVCLFVNLQRCARRTFKRVIFTAGETLKDWSHWQGEYLNLPPPMFLKLSGI